MTAPMKNTAHRLLADLQHRTDKTGLELSDCLADSVRLAGMIEGKDAKQLRDIEKRIRECSNQLTAISRDLLTVKQNVSRTAATI